MMKKANIIVSFCFMSMYFGMPVNDFAAANGRDIMRPCALLKEKDLESHQKSLNRRYDKGIDKFSRGFGGINCDSFDNKIAYLNEVRGAAEICQADTGRDFSKLIEWVDKEKSLTQQDKFRFECN
ncbi:hypothetical protein [Methylorubrum thiocyanatum]|uniref:Uncharacterized protein n=1 Tax=Methylorubrum thiocyanatum TaxID=47958 RepID=A0AA40S643_9HYPH|nr:hypothetical protein [Methylorubrum thiocyanatum]MBA8915234.1 hypothetical protein [Methylorubrum thiocyanatum]